MIEVKDIQVGKTYRNAKGKTRRVLAIWTTKWVDGVFMSVKTMAASDGDDIEWENVDGFAAKRGRCFATPFARGAEEVLDGE